MKYVFAFFMLMFRATVYVQRGIDPLSLSLSLSLSRPLRAFQERLAVGLLPFSYGARGIATQLDEQSVNASEHTGVAGKKKACVPL